METAKRKLMVGQKVFVDPSYLNRTNREPYEAEVEKIGNKYFTLVDHPRTKFLLTSLIEENQTNYKSRIYLTMQELEDFKLRNKLVDEFSRNFPFYKLTLHQLKRIKEIAEENLIK